MVNMNNSDLNGLITIAGRCRQNGNLKAAEKLMLHALRKAEERYGQVSVPVGLVLLELIDVYEEQDNHESAKEANVRMREIIMSMID